MALEKKKANSKTTIKDLVIRINELENRLSILEPKKATEGKSINKVETFNGEEEPKQRSNMSMGSKDKLLSAQNAVKILPPNLIVDGRHIAKNVSAICGFIVSEEMLDEVYAEKEKG